MSGKHVRLIHFVYLEGGKHVRMIHAAWMEGRKYLGESRDAA